MMQGPNARNFVHRVAFLATAAAAAIGVVGCTEPAPMTPTSDPTPLPASSEPVQNPLDALTDPAQDEYLGDEIAPILDAAGEGPSTFDLGAVTGQAVRFYVACSPRSEFTVSAFGKFFSGHCAPRFENSGMIPLDDTAPGVELEIPDGVRFHVVAVAEE